MGALPTVVVAEERASCRGGEAAKETCPGPVGIVAIDVAAWRDPTHGSHVSVAHPVDQVADGALVAMPRSVE